MHAFCIEKQVKMWSWLTSVSWRLLFSCRAQVAGVVSGMWLEWLHFRVVRNTHLLLSPALMSVRGAPGSGPARHWACTSLPPPLHTHRCWECPRDLMFCSEAHQGELTLPTVFVSVNFIPRLEISLCSEHEQCRPSVDKMIPQLVGI